MPALATIIAARLPPPGDRVLVIGPAALAASASLCRPGLTLACPAPPRRRARARARVPVVVASPAALPVRPGSLDALVAVARAAPPTAPLLAAWAAALRPGGRLVVVTASRRGLSLRSPPPASDLTRGLMVAGMAGIGQSRAAGLLLTHGRRADLPPPPG